MSLFRQKSDAAAAAGWRRCPLLVDGVSVAAAAGRRTG